MPDLIGGQIPMAISADVDFVDLHRGAKVRVLATFGAARSAALPDIQTASEAGVALKASGWYGIYAPAGTPEATVASLANTVSDVLSAPEVGQRLRKLGLTPTPGIGASELARITESDLAQWLPLIRKSGFKAK